MRPLQQIEQSMDDRIKHNRDYFGSGCECIHDGKIKKLSPIMSNRDALRYYEGKCKCSRNYVNDK